MRLVGVLGVAHPAPLRAALLRQGAVHLGSVQIVDTGEEGKKVLRSCSLLTSDLCSPHVALAAMEAWLARLNTGG